MNSVCILYSLDAMVPRVVHLRCHVTCVQEDISNVVHSV